MNRLENMCLELKKINQKSLLKELFADPYFKAFVVDLNTQRLFEQGTDANDIPLRSRMAQFGAFYSPRTVRIKKAKGQPTDRVTLKDTGKFYESFAFKGNLTALEFLIQANVLKKDEKTGEITNLQQEWGQDILGLSDEDLIELIALSLEIIISFVLKRILNV